MKNNKKNSSVKHPEGCYDNESVKDEIIRLRNNGAKINPSIEIKLTDDKKKKTK